MAATPTVHPATTLEEATPALDFEEPLRSGDGRYVDLNPARGDDARAQLRKQLERKQPGRPLHLAFLSHRGAGKSTELYRLGHELSAQYHTLYLISNVEMDPNRIEMEDLLLVLARAVVEEMQHLGLGLSAEALQNVEAFFGETIKHTQIGKAYIADTQSQAQAGANLGFLALSGKLTALMKVDSSERTEIKQAFRRYPGTLMDNVNRLLKEAHQRLKGELGRELLVVIDNLDRYDPAVAEQLLVLQGDRFRQLQTNLVVTPPIALMYRPSTISLEEYFRVEIMCSVPLRTRGQPYSTCSGIGRECLLKALGLRIALDTLLPDPGAQDRLLVGSGGSIRDLLELAYDASLKADGAVITIEDVEKAIRRRKSRMRDTLHNNGGWTEALIHIAKTKELGPDQAFLRVLFHRLAFKYNGEFWYDIHPLVAEISDIAEGLGEPAS